MVITAKRQSFCFWASGRIRASERYAIIARFLNVCFPIFTKRRYEQSVDK